jgi:hypothetical protein
MRIDFFNRTPVETDRLIPGIAVATKDYTVVAINSSRVEMATSKQGVVTIVFKGGGSTRIELESSRLADELVEAIRKRMR